MGVNLILDPRFSKSNTSFKNVLTNIKKVGKGDVNHHSEIEAEDLKKLYKSFAINTSCWSTRKYLAVSTRSRKSTGNDEKHILRRSGCDREAISVCTSEVDNIKDAPFDIRGEGRIYETNTCPVRSFVKYIQFNQLCGNALEKVLRRLILFGITQLRLVKIRWETLCRKYPSNTN